MYMYNYAVYMYIHVHLRVHVYTHESTQVKRFFAKQFSVREKGLREVQQSLSSVTSLPRGETNVWVRGTSELVRRALRDNVFSVS